MRKILSVLALVSALVMGGGSAAMATTGTDTGKLAACATEEATNCFWDASENGNGQGVDFHDIAGVAYYECESEDSTNCFWDAAQQGNGQGNSFTDVNGTAVYWDAVAGWSAWDAFDVLESVGMADSASQVDYAGLYDGHALGAGEVAVWDAAGNAYLFYVS